MPTCTPHSRPAQFALVLLIVSSSVAALAADLPLLPGCALPAQTFSGSGGTSTSGGALNAMSAFSAAIGGANNGSGAPLEELVSVLMALAVYWSDPYDLRRNLSVPPRFQRSLSARA